MRTLQEIQPGQTLGRYEFLVPIAEGGMASVWAARLKGSRGFSKTVAVKTMLPSVSDDPQFEQMFLDEAQIASRIRHPNVVEILDLGEQDEVLYLVMEWVDGEPLSNLRRAAAKHGGIPRSIALRVVADACSGLHAAHEMKDDGGQLVGLVHRDISPQNILITFGGDVKIVDFGVAKAAGRSTGQTIAGQVKGKPPYMSPEQALGEVVDRRTDVFALGIILYQLTTGKHPFRGESDLVTLQNIVSDKPIVSPRALDRQYPRELELVVMKALDRKRERRFQTCAELEAAIEDVFEKAVPRTRNDEVGKFMQDMLGSRGEARRKALGDSVRAADERAAGRRSFADLSGAPAGEVSSLTPTSGLMPAQVMDFGTDPRRAPVTPFDAVVPARRLRSGKGTFIVLALVVAFGGGAFMGFGKLGVLGGGTPDQSGHAAARPTAPKSTAPEVAVATVAAEAPPPPATAAPDTVTETAVPAPKGHHNTPGHSRVVAAATPSAKPVVTKPAGTSKPAAKSAFVPPPMSDPGF
jgi:tRNA A-37 threonylcarbamoyl transferase component Bud32